MLIIKCFCGFKDMKQQLFLTLSILVLLTTGISAHAGKIFRWQDDDGTWHYSATPPAGQSAESINIKAPPTSGPVSEDVTDSEENKDGSDTAKSDTTESEKEFKKSAEVEAEDKALARKNCENARKNLANLTNHKRLRINDEETGEVRYLGNDEHAEWMQRSRDEVKEYCN